MYKATIIATLSAAGLLVAGCGAPQVEAAPPERTQVQESEEAIAILRGSFEAMGGIERLRLAGGKVRIKATGHAQGKAVPVEITVGGPDRYRMDYPLEEISFVFTKGECRKIAYGVSARCTRDEAAWITPVRIISSLTFPAGDAAKLESTFRMREDTTVNGRACVVPEVRPKNTNLKIRTAYDKATRLLAEVSFYFKGADDTKSSWTVRLDDWREVKKMMVPFRRTVLHDGQEVWDETAESIDFDSFDERAFLAPVPPTTDHPLPYSMPAHRQSRIDVMGQPVDVPAPFPTVGGGAIPSGVVSEAEAAQTIRIVHRGPVSDAKALFGQLQGGAMSAGLELVGDPRIILLEEPDGPEDPALMVIYSRVAEPKVSVKVSM